MPTSHMWLVASVLDTAGLIRACYWPLNIQFFSTFKLIMRPAHQFEFDMHVLHDVTTALFANSFLIWMNESTSVCQNEDGKSSSYSVVVRLLTSRIRALNIRSEGLSFSKWGLPISLNISVKMLQRYPPINWAALWFLISVLFHYMIQP